MGKYVYISYISWREGINMDLELYANKIVPNLENDKIKLVHDGPVYGVVEDSVMIHKTDLGIDEFTNFRSEACTVDGKKLDRSRKNNHIHPLLKHNYSFFFIIHY